MEKHRVFKTSPNLEHTGACFACLVWVCLFIKQNKTTNKNKPKQPPKTLAWKNKTRIVYLHFVLEQQRPVHYTLKSQQLQKLIFKALEYWELVVWHLSLVCLAFGSLAQMRGLMRVLTGLKHWKIGRTETPNVNSGLFTSLIRLGLCHVCSCKVRWCWTSCCCSFYISQCDFLLKQQLFDRGLKDVCKP